MAGTGAMRNFYRNISRVNTIWSKHKFPKTFTNSKFLSAPVAGCSCHCYCTQVLQGNEVTVRRHHGLTVIRVPLPSRAELCEFTLKPLGHTVEDFINFLKKEDGGVDRAAVYSTDGCRISQSTSVDIILNSPFDLQINDKTYSVSPPQRSILDQDEEETLCTVKSMISDLYSKLNLEEYQMRREEDLMKRFETISMELRPLQQIEAKLAATSHRHTLILKWTGLGLMGVQFGVLARLTWWEYSWDIMEPVTFFVTYGTAIAMYAYFILTKQEYIYPDVFDRQYLLRLHKFAKLEKLDIHKFNRLKKELAQIELDLQRLRDPLQLHLPIQQVMSDKL